jgi:hypothetical protein
LGSLGELKFSQHAPRLHKDSGYHALREGRAQVLSLYFCQQFGDLDTKMEFSLRTNKSGPEIDHAMKLALLESFARLIVCAIDVRSVRAESNHARWIPNLFYSQFVLQSSVIL